MAPHLRNVGAVPLRVKLLNQAAAKSHRPQQLFSSSTCPIVGAGALGELFVRATTDGLVKLATAIREGTSDQMVKELSCVDSIEPVTPAYRRRGLGPADILRRSPRSGHGFVTRVRLFDFGQNEYQQALVADLESTCAAQDLPLDPTGYSPHSYTYAVECRCDGDVEKLSRLVGVRSITGMPLIRTIQPQMFNPLALPALVARSDYDGEVPVVVVVDSGVSSGIPELESWVVGRDSMVAPSYRNPDHGTFVAGLICWGANLNPTISGIDSNPCAVFDLQVVPNDDPNRGDIEAITEQQFLVALEPALQQHANDYKVWNISLGTNAVCSLDEFSTFAEELDNLQEKYQVSFVISAGNYVTPPLLEYPRTDEQLERGRITAPADSVLGIAVGSLSHVDYRVNGPRIHHPSAFSRHGAGPNYVIKPDLVHYGGSCSLDASHISGIRSVNAGGSAENLGTSFSTPLVSRVLAQIYHQVTPEPRPVLARALLIHHARDPRSDRRVPDGEENYFGFGVPAPVPYCLECTPFSSTLVFDDALRPGYYLEWDDFPYPASLCRDGRYFGEITMTVAFEPARGSRWGSEYCETHVDAHFGVYRDRVSRTTGEISTEFRGLVPPEHKNPGILYESYQVAKLRKWAPVRTYYGNLGERGVAGSRWRLKVQLLTRHSVEDDDSWKPQPFSLVITIADPGRAAPVYDEMARSLQARFQSQNLALRTAARIRTKA